MLVIYNISIYADVDDDAGVGVCVNLDRFLNPHLQSKWVKDPD